MPTQKKEPANTLAEKMLQVLEAQRRLGADSYPLTLQRLVELADPAASPELAHRAASTRKLFRARAIMVQPKNPSSPVALAEDLEPLAASPLVLNFLLNLLCDAQHPMHETRKLKSKLPAKLRPAFEAALRRQIEENRLPPGVALVRVQPKNYLHLTRYPLPKAPELALAENLLHTLQMQRKRGKDVYPLTLSRLVELTEPGVADSRVKKAMAQPVLQEAVLVAMKNCANTPVALIEDRELLVGSSLLLEGALTLARRNTDQICTLAKVRSKVIPPLQLALEEAIRRRIETRSLPPAVGCLWQRNKPVLFLIRDVLNTPPEPARSTTGEEKLPTEKEGVRGTAATSPEGTLPVAPARPASTFTRAWDEAFQQLDRQRGSHNFVSLLDLRRALPVDRPTFDAELRHLRRAGRYTLSGAEGRHGVSPEEQEAGIQEDGCLLLFVSRKLS